MSRLGMYRTMAKAAPKRKAWEFSWDVVAPAQSPQAVTRSVRSKPVALAQPKATTASIFTAAPDSATRKSRASSAEPNLPVGRKPRNSSKPGKAIVRQKTPAWAFKWADDFREVALPLEEAPLQTRQADPVVARPEPKAKQGRIAKLFSGEKQSGQSILSLEEIAAVQAKEVSTPVEEDNHPAHVERLAEAPPLDEVHEEIQDPETNAEPASEAVRLLDNGPAPSSEHQILVRPEIASSLPMLRSNRRSFEAPVAEDHGDLRSRLVKLERMAAREAEKRAQAEQEAKLERQNREHAEAEARRIASELRTEKAAREAAQRQQFDEAARYGEERKARVVAERTIQELQEKIAGPFRPSTDGKTTFEQRDGASGGYSADRVFQNFKGGGPEALDASSDDVAGRKPAREIINMPGRFGQPSRTVEVVRTGASPRAVPFGTQRRMTSTILSSDSPRGRLALNSGFRTNPESILAQTEGEEQRQASGELAAGLTPTDLIVRTSEDIIKSNEAVDARRLQQMREKVGRDPLVRDIVQAVSMMMTMEGKPDMVAKVVALLTTVRRNLSVAEMKVMGSTASGMLSHP
jgi:hypothetical protein